MVRFFVEIKFYSFAIFLSNQLWILIFLNEMSTRPNSNKTVKFDISNNQDAINYFLSYIRMEMWLAYAIIITSFCFSSTFLILFFGLKDKMVGKNC